MPHLLIGLRTKILFDFYFPTLSRRISFEMLGGERERVVVIFRYVTHESKGLCSQGVSALKFDLAWRSTPLL